ncbi:sulfotransferase family 2 domain-containing protein [Rubellimicrobium roseum]|uniref:Sulfotransferase family protein n=1 Tax=Rubellimicrobium roseum TaxID=687525 RepID=A0A5C4NCV3_9RHOB|nr:sulfotransferase family 2 domain-containing protein [Rubellimicrobium roseum]TNC66821.1 sulfotransferase family protein [Rubellimicrobium roseum]
MPLFRHAEEIVLFVHIPKTGGSTVENVLRASGAKQALKAPKSVGFSHCTPQHMHWEVTRQWIPRRFYDYSLAIVRNPFARLASEYRWREKFAKSPLAPFDRWVESQFRNYVDNQFILDNHIRPQHEFIGDDVEVFQLEDGLDKPLQACLTRLGLSAKTESIPRANQSKSGTINASSATVERIAEFYAEDFTTFGYSATEIPEGVFNTPECRVA